jgi:hypothetical protein
MIDQNPIQEKAEIFLNTSRTEKEVFDKHSFNLETDP